MVLQVRQLERVANKWRIRLWTFHLIGYLHYLILDHCIGAYIDFILYYVCLLV
jgi:hypothetical protein